MYKLFISLTVVLASSFFSCDEKKNIEKQYVKFQQRNKIQLYHLNTIQTRKIKNFGDSLVFHSIGGNEKINQEEIEFKDLNRFIDSISKYITFISGGLTDSATYVGFGNINFSEEYFCKKGSDILLKNKLNGYCDKLTSLGYKNTYIALDAKDDFIYKYEIKKRNMTFSDIYFNKKDVLDLLMLLDYFKREVAYKRICFLYLAKG